ncbi:cytoskeletal protein CcmA (bactofilin family) [Brockia lithotrophica]|uniref:Cytoskeletal protein CcmA (Bactofilin family) n=1 Tax=Brockia lithotrophica TaxID=933949 RepID=A0A660KV50_9BACL|nr:cytoskeletal protein CcmA (bactofilin family) [Brockia lithotrophica]
MLSRKKGPSTERPAGEGRVTYLDASTRVEGTLASEAAVRMDGSFRGDIHCQGELIVGPSGQVEGDVWAQGAQISGRFRGKLIAEGTVILRRGSRFEGELHYRDLVVEEGAHLVGTFQRLEEEPLEAGTPVGTAGDFYARRIGRNREESEVAKEGTDTEMPNEGGVS